jgi:hypothetical protein
LAVVLCVHCAVGAVRVVRRVSTMRCTDVSLMC